MVEIPATKANMGLAGAVNKRIAADASILAARAALWRFAGLSMLALAIGGGVGLAFWGYARTLDASTQAQKIADAIADAMARTTVTAKIDENSRVRLDARGETVRIEPNSTVGVTGTVGLDPNARVKLDEAATVSLPRPTQQQLGPMATAQTPQPRIHTSFTVFKEVEYQGGQVVTGYTFVGDETKPAGQYCYYSTPRKNSVSMRVDLATDGLYTPPKGEMKLNAREAAQSCVWFDGAPTRFF